MTAAAAGATGAGAGPPPWRWCSPRPGSALPEPLRSWSAGALHHAATGADHLVLRSVAASPGEPRRVDGDGTVRWDHVAVLLVRHGGVELASASGRVALGAGDVAVLDLLRPFSVASLAAGRTDDALFVFPRALARPLVASDRPHGSRHGAVVRTRDPAAALVRGYLDVLAEPDAEACIAARGVIEGLATVLATHGRGDGRGDGDGDGDGGGRDRMGSAADLRRRLDDHVEAHLGDAALSPARLAEALGVSRATLYRVAAGGDGVAGILRDRRLDRAFLLLTDPALGNESFASIARAVGLSGTDGLRRQFHARFGQSPAELRAARRGRGAPRGSADGGRLDAWFRALQAGEAREAREARTGPAASPSAAVSPGAG